MPNEAFILITALLDRARKYFPSAVITAEVASLNPGEPVLCRLKHEKCVEGTYDWMAIVELGTTWKSNRGERGFKFDNVAAVLDRYKASIDAAVECELLSVEVMFGPPSPNPTTKQSP